MIDGDAQPVTHRYRGDRQPDAGGGAVVTEAPALRHVYPREAPDGLPELVIVLSDCTTLVQPLTPAEALYLVGRIATLLSNARPAGEVPR